MLDQIFVINIGVVDGTYFTGLPNYICEIYPFFSLDTSEYLERLAVSANIASVQVKVQSYNSGRVVFDWAIPVPKKIIYLLHVPLEKMFFFFKYFLGDFFSFCSYNIQHCFICRPSDSTVPTDARIEPRTVATGALAVRRSNH